MKNEKIEDVYTKVKSEKRMLLYTDTIKGEQISRDDMWAITTLELEYLCKQAITDTRKQLLDEIMEEVKEIKKLKNMGAIGMVEMIKNVIKSKY